MEYMKIHLISLEQDLENIAQEMELLDPESKACKELDYETRCYACQSYDCVEYCDNDCGQFCSECNEGSWRDEEAMKECQTHMVLLDTTEKAEV